MHAAGSDDIVRREETGGLGLRRRHRASWNGDPRVTVPWCYRGIAETYARDPRQYSRESLIRVERRPLAPPLPPRGSHHVARVAFDPSTEPLAMSSRTALLEEDAVQATFDALLRDRAPAQIGLLVGKLEVGTRDFVLALVPFPDWKDDEEGAGGAAARADTALDVDEDWIVEHATQVSRMLPGGVDVVGTYAFASDAAFKTASAALTSATVEIARAANAVGVPATRSHHQRADHRLVLHLSSTTRKRTLRRCVVPTSRSAPIEPTAPVEHATGRVASQMVRIDARHEIHLRLDGTDVADGTDLRDIAARVVEAEATRVAASEALLAGEFRKPDDVVAAVAEAANADTVDGARRVEAILLCPPRSTAIATSEDRGGDRLSGRATLRGDRLSGRARLRGAVSARAYAYGRESVARAVAHLKSDIIASLRARLDLLVDEAERDDGDTANGVSPRPLAEGAPRNAAEVRLPRRAWVRWREGCAVCDYLVDGETAADVVERCEEVLRWKPPGGEAAVALEEAPAANAEKTSTPTKKPNPNATRASSKGEDGGSNAGEASTRISSYATYLAGAGAALVAAALADLALGISSSSPECVGEMCAAMGKGL